MEFEKMTKQEKSLLIFLETAYVDHAGKLSLAHMNEADRSIAKRWTKEKYIDFGRVCFNDITSEKNHYVFLSDEAMEHAHKERKARAIRLQAARKWKTTTEKTKE